MNPYDKYLSLNYERLSEKEMMEAITGLFAIDPTTKAGLFDEWKHYIIVRMIIIASLKFKYKAVCDKLRNIYPLSFPEIEKDPQSFIEGKTRKQPSGTITPVYPQTEEDKKRLDEMNEFIKNLKRKTPIIYNCHDFLLLIDVMEQYQKLLSDEIESMVGLAHMHGYSSTRHEEGEKLRKQIQEFKIKLGI